MKKNVSLHLVLRLAALAAVPSFCVVDYIRMGAFPVDVMSVNIWTALLILMLYPVPHDPVVQPAAASAVAARTMNVWRVNMMGTTFPFDFLFWNENKILA